MKCAPHQCFELVVREFEDGRAAQGVPTFRHDVALEWQRLGHRVDVLTHTTCEHGAGHFGEETKTEIERIDATHTLEEYIAQATRMKSAPSRRAGG